MNAVESDTARLRGLDARYVAPLLGFFVAWAVMHAGMPALRHDWRVPISKDSEGPWLDGLSDGWLPAGIGNPQPYPTFYLVGLTIRPLAYFFDSTALIWLAIACGVALAAWAASDLARTRGASGPTQLAVAGFAALNPWVYTKLVAGHMLMVFAYGVIFALVAEVARSRPRAIVLLPLIAFSITQIELCAIAFVPLVVWIVRTRRWLALVVLLAAIAPIAFGIAAEFGDIAGTPITLAWQRSQSLRPGSALALDGYFTHYARAFAAWTFVSYLFAAAALAGVPAALRSRPGRLALGLAIALLTFAMGTDGPLAVPYAWLVEHVPEIGLFRELYDLIALVAIAYVALLLDGPARRGDAGVVLAIAAACFFVPWLSTPPTTFFIPARAIPEAPSPPDALERVAYLPAFQPMSYGGRGSGVDPDAYARTGRASPLNEAFPLYPVDAALARLALGDDSFARSLDVGTVVRRPYLESDVGALRSQRVAVVDGSPRSDRYRDATAIPLLTIVATPRTVAIGADPGTDGVFFGDRDPHAIARFRANVATIDPAVGWVDARLDVALAPGAASAFGGVVTTSTVPLLLPSGGPWHDVLAVVRGELVDGQGRIVARSTSAPKWWRVSAGATELECRGTCTLLLVGDVPRALPDELKIGAFVALEPSFRRPWFATAAIPPFASGALRLAIRYDRGWACLVDSRPLSHVRFATTLNGWEIAASSHVRTAVFVDVVAATQALLEFVAFGIVVLATFVSVRKAKATRRL